MSSDETSEQSSVRNGAGYDEVLIQVMSSKASHTRQEGNVSPIC